MVGRLHTISNVDWSGLGLGPQIVVDELDMIINRMTGLVHYIDPARFMDADGNVFKKGRSRGDNGLFEWTSDDLVVVTSDAAFNGKPVFNFIDDDADMLGPLGTPTESFTIIIVASIAAARLAGVIGSYMAATYNPEVNPNSPPTAFGGEVAMQFALSAGPPKLMSVSPEVNTSGNALNIDASLMPAGDVAAIWAWSFDADTGNSPATMTSEFYVNDALNPVGTKLNHTQKPRVSDTTRWAIGWNQFGADTGWVGKYGRVLIFNRAYHVTDQDREKLDALFDGLREFYDIA